MHPINLNIGKEPIVPDNVDTLADNELSSGSSPPLSLSPAKYARGSAKAKSHKRLLHHLTFNDVVSGASCRVRREIGRRQNQLVWKHRLSFLLLPSSTNWSPPPFIDFPTCMHGDTWLAMCQPTLTALKNMKFRLDFA